MVGSSTYSWQFATVMDLFVVIIYFFRVRTSIDLLGCQFWVYESYWTRGRTPLDEGSALVKACTDTGQHNIQTQEAHIHAPIEIRTPDPSNQESKTYTLNRAATGIS
jgi:hypothetical protein